MSTPTALTIDLAGVARLAGVRRSVVSMWRSRFAKGPDPFPASIGEKNGSLQFDGEQVAQWLARTNHGNNPDALKDVAASSTPPGFSYSDTTSVARLEALITLSALRDGIADLTPASIRHAAAQHDPDDLMLQTEVVGHTKSGHSWLSFADSLIDAAYSPSGAMALLQERSASVSRTAGSSGPLAQDAIALVEECTMGLNAQSDAIVIIDTDVQLASVLASAISDQGTLALRDGTNTRAVRRRLRAEGHWFEEESTGDKSRAIQVTRLLPKFDDNGHEMLRALDEVSLAMRESDAAIVIGPARLLTDALEPSREQMRAEVLRSGRVRGIVRLKSGLVDSATRESLALWVLGGPGDALSIEERRTAVADLTDMELTRATRADLISDLLLSLASSGERRGHSFRFVTFVPTTTLQASQGSLVGLAHAKPNASSHPSKTEIPALLDMAAEVVRDDLTPATLVVAAHEVPNPLSISTLIRNGHLRLISGTRLAPGLEGSDGFTVVKSAALDDPNQIGKIQVNQFDFAASHPRARLTEPGDIVFRTSPTAAAWVDPDGYKVVAYPARILRIVAADPGGLVPEIVAADIRGAHNGPGSWKKWILRRVAPATVPSLRKVLFDIAGTQAALRARVSGLEEYAALLVAGVTAGTVQVTHTFPNEITTEK